jgi:CubicO group peptidase (beta-lactamase class C family)
MKIPISSDYHLETNRFLSGGGGLCSTANDYMRFFQMLLNGGELDGVRLLKDETVSRGTALVKWTPRFWMEIICAKTK